MKVRETELFGIEIEGMRVCDAIAVYSHYSMEEIEYVNTLLIIEGNKRFLEGHFNRVWIASNEA